MIKRGKKKGEHSKTYSLVFVEDFSLLKCFLNLCGQNVFFGNEKELSEFKRHNCIASAIDTEASELTFQSPLEMSKYFTLKHLY